MPRWFSPADAAACLAAGVGAWFTRASLDVFAGPAGEARVAMLPGPAELVGLVTLACISAFLLRTIFDRRHGAAAPRRTGNSTRYLLLPLVSVLVIAIPYVPWLADVVPASRALAGPARFAIWALVCGQVAWIVLDLADVPDHRSGYRDSLRHRWPALVLAASLAAGGALARHAPPDAFGPGDIGDASLGLRLSLVAIVSTWLWLSAQRAAGSRAAATTAWLAIAGAAPFLLSAIFVPKASAAAACVVLAVAWPADAGDTRAWTAGVRGIALGVLAWLGAAYVPLVIVLAACLVWRMRHARPALVAAGVPLILAAAALAWFAPPGWAPPAGSPPSMLWTAAARLADQQDGLLLYSPAVALAVPGLWLLWRDGGNSRVAAVAAVGGTTAALLTAGWHGDITRTLAIPGAPLAPVLPLLVAPIARWLRQGALVMPRVALARVLVLWGVILTVALPLARGDAALVRRGSGMSGLLEWLAPSRDLVRIAPIAPGAGNDPLAFAASTLIWVVVAIVLWRLIARTRPASQASAAVIAMLSTLAALAVGTAAVEATLGPRLPSRVAPGLRVEAPMLDGFDARRRPLALAYDRWRPLPAAGVPPLFSFDATPGARRSPQPLRVLLNARLSLPAGDYTVTLHPKSGAALNGAAGLQVGRIGPPMREWQVAAAPGEPWTAGFTLPVDASFVGLRTTPEFEGRVAALRVQPARVVNNGDRRQLPTVVSSAVYKNVMVTFHGNQVYAERNGFWVRGRATLLATFAPPVEPSREPGVRLSLHGGAAPTRVRFETANWGTTIGLEPGVSRELLVPALEGQTLLPVRITPEGGFIPADAQGGSDRRLLGCWIEVLE
jgi:hypothetical protein